MAENEESLNSDGARWRAFTHPIRVAILQTLDDGQPWRTTSIAEAIGVPPNSVSFHVRALVKYGLAEPVDDASGDRDGRTSVWRRVPALVQIPDPRENPNDLAAARAAAKNYEQEMLARTASWFAQATNVDASQQTFNFDESFSVSSLQLAELQSEIRELLARFVARSDDDSDASLRVHLWGFGVAVDRSVEG